MFAPSMGAPAPRSRRCMTGGRTSTYIRRPPYWEGALAGERTLKWHASAGSARDNITTDHLSPSNAIMRDTRRAVSTWRKMGLPEEDFNSYATHRGDHLTAQRATFANPQLVNEMAVVDGKVKKGLLLARIEPEGKVMRMWEAIETYMERKQPLIIIAGADYGQGSSRDWAAKGVRLGGRGSDRRPRVSSASIAPNLIGMGVLPLEFKPGTDSQRRWAWMAPKPTMSPALARPRRTLTLVIHRRDGERHRSAGDLPPGQRRRGLDLRRGRCCSGSHRTSSSRVERQPDSSRRWSASACDPRTPSIDRRSTMSQTSTATGTVRLHRVLQSFGRRRHLSAPSLIPTPWPRATPLASSARCTRSTRASGGSYRMSASPTRSTGSSHSFGGTYFELVPGELIRYTDKFDDPGMPGEMIVTVEAAQRAPAWCTRTGHRPGRHPPRRLLAEFLIPRLGKSLTLLGRSWSSPKSLFG